MNKSTWITLLVIAVVALLAFSVGRFIYYGGSSASAYTPPERPRPTIEVESAPMSARLEAVDNPQESRGVVAIDYTHDNALFIEELNVLLSKIVDRGYSYEIIMEGSGNGSDDENGSPGNGDGLIDKLRYANALILPLTRSEYTPEEVSTIQRFVDTGGRVLMIGDPTRTAVMEPLNSVAGAFDIIFVNDYLYSLESKDNNYRNVIYTNFAESPVTEGLNDESKVIFYSGSSLYAPGYEIILADDVTYSSTSEGGRNLAAAALTTDDKVLALGDLTFFSEPYSNAENNETLINNIAGFLTGGERDHALQDFPYLFNPNVDIVYDDSLVFNSQFDNSVKLKTMLEELDYTVAFFDEIDDENDVIFVGRFDELDPVEEYLAAANINILEANQKTELEEAEADPAEEADQNKLALISDEAPDIESQFVEGRIQIEGVGELERGGSTLFHLHQEDGRNILIILSDNPDTNADAFDLLMKEEFTDCLVSPTTAVCQTEEPGGKLPPSLRSFRIDTILIVSDDSGRERDDAQTSTLDYFNVLSDTYTVDTWTTSTDGYPELGEVLEYDALIWTTGDYWDDSIGAEGAQLLMQYVEAGGNLMMSGASIAFDWEHTDFLSVVPHAQYQGFGEQTDLEVNLMDHPLAAGFTGNGPIEFIDGPSGEPLPIDIVSNTSDARAVFRRGFGSEEPGAASVIAYEDNRVKIAYFAFPMYLMPSDAQVQMINNTIKWFTKKPLPLPDGSDYQPPEPGEDEEPSEEEPEETPPPDNGEEDDNGENGNGDDENEEQESGS
jgi:hypothetical protein